MVGQAKHIADLLKLRTEIDEKSWRFVILVFFVYFAFVA
jgi:hypothetical protein